LKSWSEGGASLFDEGEHAPIVVFARADPANPSTQCRGQASFPWSALTAAPTMAAMASLSLVSFTVIEKLRQ